MWSCKHGAQPLLNIKVPKRSYLPAAMITIEGQISLWRLKKTGAIACSRLPMALPSAIVKPDGMQTRTLKR